MGSVALGSLLLTIVEILRLLLWKLKKDAQQTQNKALQYLFACFQCIMTCIEKIVKFINRNAYIFIAISGKAFCASVKKILILGCKLNSTDN